MKEGGLITLVLLMSGGFNILYTEDGFRDLDYSFSPILTSF